MSNIDAIAAALARLCGPLLVTLGVSMLLLSPAGGGVGFVAGLCLALGVGLHALVFGVSASRRVFPPVLMRAALCTGLMATVVGVDGVQNPWSARLVEAGLFALSAGGASLVFVALFGRAAALRDDAW